jgi:hypothetical protein
MIDSDRRLEVVTPGEKNSGYVPHREFFVTGAALTGELLYADGGVIRGKICVVLE